MMERMGSMRINQIVITRNTIKRSMIRETVTKSLAMLSKLSKTMMRVKTMANMTKRLWMKAKWTMIWFERLETMLYLKKFIKLNDGAKSPVSFGKIQISMPTMLLYILIQKILLNMHKTQPRLNGKDQMKYLLQMTLLLWKIIWFQVMLNKVFLTTNGCWVLFLLLLWIPSF